MKYAFIYRNRRVWPISVQCRVLRVSVAGYYEHFGRSGSIGVLIHQRTCVSIKTFANLMYRLKIPLGCVLFGDPLVRSDLSPVELSEIKEQPCYRKATDVRREMQRALVSSPAISLIDLARQLGYKKTTRLYQIDPDLSRRISARFRAAPADAKSSNKAVKPRLKASQLEAWLKSNLRRRKPLPIHSIAPTTRKKRRLRRMFPELCSGTDAKIAELAKLKKQEVIRELKRAARSIPPTSFDEVVRRTGVSIKKLRSLAPLQAEQLANVTRRFRQKLLSKQAESLRRFLMDWPPTSIIRIASRLNTTEDWLSRNHPKLISKLSSRRKQYLQELKKQREQSLDREVRAIVERLQSQEIPVTIARVNAELKGKHRWEDPKIRRALNAALEISKTSPDQSANRRKAA